jgi:solute:Na+ symporter, SSS family
MALHWTDLLVVLVYLIGVTVFGAHFRKTQHSLRDYFLGGRRLPWWAISLSVVSAETSILTIISTPGIAYRSNMAFLQLVLGYIAGRVVVSLLFVPRYFAGEMFTAYQLIERRFGRGLKVFTAGLFLLTRALAEGVRVFAISIVVEVVFRTGVLTSVIVITLLTLFYTFEGGLTAVIWTDVIQLSIYLGGTTAAVILALHSLPGGWTTVSQIAQSSGDKLSVFNFTMNWREPYIFWSGLMGGAFLTCASHGTDQLIVQRLLAARNKRQSQAALLSSGLVILVQFSLFLIVGVVLFAFYHQRDPRSAARFGRPDQVFPTFVVTQLPHGLAGLLIAAIISAAMANLSAALNALASSSVVDFYRPFVRPEAQESHYMRVSRRLTLVWGVVLILIALAVRQMRQSVLEMALSIASVPYGSMLGIFFLGVLTRRATGRATLIGALAGLGVLLLVIAFTSVAWTWYVAIGACTTFVVGLAASKAESQVRSSEL